ncbi:hypothetical protein Krac_4025 [Ktedonobacter racemifer DSM 44963]|uniref:Uncharacterized protein n=1 Tax=Ktedonobacter racemifer DSM 44963 TaxID=485913 RepID=D6TXQ6_KTERA|nr:hypothetical protein Krac_4025 [Ktedonobacter racemifer DSM 44963]
MTPFRGLHFKSVVFQALIDLVNTLLAFLDLSSSENSPAPLETKKRIGNQRGKSGVLMLLVKGSCAVETREYELSSLLWGERDSVAKLLETANMVPLQAIFL